MDFCIPSPLLMTIVADGSIQIIFETDKNGDNELVVSKMTVEVKPKIKVVGEKVVQIVEVVTNTYSKRNTCSKVGTSTNAIECENTNKVKA